MARTGGILTFVMIGVVVLAVLLSMAAQASPAIGIISLLLNLAAFVIWFIVMIALRSTLAQNGYHRASGPIWTIIILVVAIVILSIVAAVVGGTQMARSGATSPNPEVILRALGIWAIIILAITVCLEIFFLILGGRLVDYSRTGGGIWKGAGIVLIVGTCLMLVALVLYAITVLTQAWALAVVAGILAFVAAVVWLAFWIILGIAFMSDAKRVEAARA